MEKKLKLHLIYAKTKSNNLKMVKNLNLWGHDLCEVSIIEEMINLEVLSLSINSIDTLKHFRNLFNLRELYLRRNKINDIQEIQFLNKLKNLKILWLSENPISSVPFYREKIIKILPHLEKLDDKPITDEEKEYAMSFSNDNFQESEQFEEKQQELDYPRNRSINKQQRSYSRYEHSPNIARSNTFTDGYYGNESELQSKSRSKVELEQKRHKNTYENEHRNKSNYYDNDQKKVNQEDQRKNMSNYDQHSEDFRNISQGRNQDYKNSSNNKLQNNLTGNSSKYSQENSHQYGNQDIQPSKKKIDHKKEAERIKKEHERELENKYKLKQLEKKRSIQNTKKVDSHPIRNENIFTAVMLLIGDLNVTELEILRNECEKKIREKY